MAPMEIVSKASTIAGLVVSLSAIICVSIPNLRNKIIGKILAKHHSETHLQEMDSTLAQIKAMLSEHVACDEAKSEAMRCLLRDRITDIYYKRLPSGELRSYELEDLTKLYESYKALNGNSYVEAIYRQMVEEWKVSP